MIAQTVGPPVLGRFPLGDIVGGSVVDGGAVDGGVGEGLGVGVGDGSSAALVTVMVAGSSLMVTDSGSMDSSVQPAGRVGSVDLAGDAGGDAGEALGHAGGAGRDVDGDRRCRTGRRCSPGSGRTTHPGRWRPSICLTMVSSPTTRTLTMLISMMSVVSIVISLDAMPPRVHWGGMLGSVKTQCVPVGIPSMSTVSATSRRQGEGDGLVVGVAVAVQEGGEGGGGAGDRAGQALGDADAAGLADVGDGDDDRFTVTDLAPARAR